MMNADLKDKVAIVTGASRGIGRAIAYRLSQEGMKLVIAARTRALLDEVARDCGPETVLFCGDLREEHAPQQLVEQALARFGRLDLLVNNAGATKRGDFFELSEADWQDGFALKFYCAVRAARAAWPALIASKGCIVNIVGVGGRTGSAEFAIGGAVNAALMNFTKVMADRGVKEGVRVNAINPGAIATERLQTRIKIFSVENRLSLEDAATAMASKLGIARFGKPEEIAELVAFLASAKAAYLQGAIIDADGGQTRTL